MEIQIINEQQTPSLAFLDKPESFGKDNKELIEKMFDFIQYRSAVGLAANQVSIDGERCLQRFFIEKNPKTDKWSVVINPKITERIGMTDFRLEGCLTWPGYEIACQRYRRIKVVYYTIDGEYKEETITKFRAHIWQHEINHLDGVEEKVEKTNTTQVTPWNFQRNDICPCGSEKKYKVCCQPFEPELGGLYRIRK